MSADLDDLIARLFAIKSQGIGTPARITPAEVEYLCNGGIAALKKQSCLLELQPPVTILGDIHGQFHTLLRFFDEMGKTPDDGSKFLFLGDYVDRGWNSIETFCLLLAYKIRRPVEAESCCAGNGGGSDDVDHQAQHPNCPRVRLVGNQQRPGRVAGEYICNFAYFYGLTQVGSAIRGCLFAHIPFFDVIPPDEQVARVVPLVEAIVRLLEFAQESVKSRRLFVLIMIGIATV
jgi:hypothetical protein